MGFVYSKSLEEKEVKCDGCTQCLERTNDDLNFLATTMVELTHTL